MKKRFLAIVLGGLLMMQLANSCNSNQSGASSIATDTASINLGESVFSTNCSSCHNFRQDGIGPKLAGVTMEMSRNGSNILLKIRKR